MIIPVATFRLINGPLGTTIEWRRTVIDGDEHEDYLLLYVVDR